MRTIKREIVGAFIFSSDDKLLLGKAGVYAENWVIPGGGIDEGETKLDAVIRETLEETGIDISNATIEPVEKTLTGQSEKTLRDTGERVLVDMTFHDFKIVLNKKAADIKLKIEDDFTDAQWVPINQLKDLKLSPPTIEFLKDMGYL